MASRITVGRAQLCPFLVVSKKPLAEKEFAQHWPDNDSLGLSIRYSPARGVLFTNASASSISNQVTTCGLDEKRPGIIVIYRTPIKCQPHKASIGPLFKGEACPLALLRNGRYIRPKAS